VCKFRRAKNVGTVAALVGIDHAGGARADAIPNAADGEGGHKPDPVIHRSRGEV